jgi:hypothetical protein
MVTLVTLVMFVTLLVLVVLPLLTLRWMCMPGWMTGGALVTTAGGVPTGAGMMIPGREPGGGGTKTP